MKSCLRCRVGIPQAVTLAVLLAAMPAASQVQSYPTRPIRLIVPFPPGGSNDILGRLIAQRLSDRYGRQVVVDNRGGADGIIGSDIAARATPDGHTLLVVSASHVMNAAIHKLPYDAERSFTPIALIGSGPNLLSVHPAFPARSVGDLITMARQQPGSVNYASTGVGGFNHFGGEYFKLLARVELNHVPYKGGGPALAEVVAGQVPVLFSTLIGGLPQVRAGRLRALGTGGQKRSSALPDVPTIHEAGVPGYEVNNWWGVLGPAGMAPALAARINADINAIVGHPETRKRLETEAAEPSLGDAASFGRRIATDLARWAQVARDAKIAAQ